MIECIVSPQFYGLQLNGISNAAWNSYFPFAAYIWLVPSTCTQDTSEQNWQSSLLLGADITTAWSALLPLTNLFQTFSTLRNFGPPTLACVLGTTSQMKLWPSGENFSSQNSKTCISYSSSLPSFMLIVKKKSFPGWVLWPFHLRKVPLLPQAYFLVFVVTFGLIIYLVPERGLIALSSALDT